MVSPTPSQRFSVSSDDELPLSLLVVKGHNSTVNDSHSHDNDSTPKDDHVAITSIPPTVSPWSPYVEIEAISSASSNSSSSPPSPSSTVPPFNEPSSSNKKTEDNQTESYGTSPVSIPNPSRTSSFESLRSPSSVPTARLTPSSTNHFNDEMNLFVSSESHHVYTQSYGPPNVTAYSPRSFMFIPSNPFDDMGFPLASFSFSQVFLFPLPYYIGVPLVQSGAAGILNPITIYNNQRGPPFFQWNQPYPSYVNFPVIDQPVLLQSSLAQSLYGREPYGRPRMDSSAHVQPRSEGFPHGHPRTGVSHYGQSRVAVGLTFCLLESEVLRDHTYSVRQQHPTFDFARQYTLFPRAAPTSADNGFQRRGHNSLFQNEPRRFSTEDRQLVPSRGNTRASPPRAPSSTSSPQPSHSISRTRPLRETDTRRSVTHEINLTAEREPDNFMHLYVFPALRRAIAANRDLILRYGSPTEPVEFPVPIFIRRFACSRHPPNEPLLTFHRSDNATRDVNITVYEATNTVTRLALISVNVLFPNRRWVTFLIATAQNSADPNIYSQFWCLPVL